MSTQAKTSCVVLFFFFLSSCLALTCTTPTGPSMDHALGGLPTSWGLLSNTTKLVVPEFIDPPTQHEKTEACAEIGYTELAQRFWELLCRDFQRSSAEGEAILKHSWQWLYAKSNEMILTSFEIVLGLLIRVWSFVIYVMLYAAWSFVTQWTMHALLLLCLGFLTKISIRALQFVFGDWFVSQCAALLVAAIKLPWTCLKTVFFKPRSGIEKEMAVKGFKTHDINMKPPRDSQLILTWDDGSHAGYATCVRLFDGTNGLVTAAHCRKPGGFVVSTKTGNKIPIGAFKPICADHKADFALFEGPMEWESLLGCKAVAITPMYLIRRGSVSHYRYVDGEWFQRNALLGESVSHEHYNKFALQVLSNTDKGDSGAGYYVGKDLVGIHLGASITENHNAMMPVLPIPGLTIPLYQLETTAPAGKVYSSKIYEDALQSMHRTMDFISSLREKGIEVWGDEDMIDDLEYDPESRHPAVTKESTDGPLNGERSTACETTGPAAPSQDSATPTPAIDTSSSTMLEAIVAAVVARIDTASIEKMVAKEVQAKVNRPRRRSARNKQKTTAATSPPSTTGKNNPVKSPASQKPASSQNTTSQNRKGSPNSGGSSSGNTHTWRPKQRGSVGPSSAQKPNSRH
nr:P1 protein [Cowpea polerovirus 1]